MFFDISTFFLSFERGGTPVNTAKRPDVPSCASQFSFHQLYCVGDDAWWKETWVCSRAKTRTIFWKKRHDHGEAGYTANIFYINIVYYIYIKLNYLTKKCVIGNDVILLL